MLSRLRGAIYQAVTGPLGDSITAVRVSKDLARRMNATIGRPLAPQDELARRAAARQRLAALRAAGRTDAVPMSVEAPVLVYFERDRNVRELSRIEELLKTRGYAWKRLDVAGDDATIDFVRLKAKCQRDDLPVVFVADRPIGGYAALAAADVAGDLERAVRGD